MGLLSTFKEIRHHVAQGARKVVEGIGYAVVSAVDYGIEKINKLAEKTANVCRKASGKLKKWATRLIPKEFALRHAKKADAPLVANANAVIKEHFPEGVHNTALNSTPEKRMKLIEDLVPKAAQAMGLKNPPKLEWLIPENVNEMDSLYGSYRHSDNTIRINLAKVVSGEPELFQEQVSTIFHEMVHARQWEAVSAWADEKPFKEYGYSEYYIKIMAKNFCHYIRPGENYEAYTKQPVEAEAYWLESQIRSSIY